MLNYQAGILLEFYNNSDYNEADKQGMIRMKKLEPGDYQTLQHFLKLADYCEYNSNLVTMVMWNHLYEIQIEKHEHFVLLLVNYHHRLGWLMPLCEKQYRRKAIDAMKQYSEENHLAFEIHSMTHEFKQWCEEEKIDFVYHYNYDAQDYVYDVTQQATLAGKKMQKRRNHYNAFINEYQNRFYLETLSEKHFPQIKEFLKEWQNDHSYSDTINAETIGIQKLFEQYETLDYHGCCLFIDNKLQAFIIASYLSDDTVEIHVEKANRNIRGLYVAVLKHYLMTLPDNVKYVNREDDMGLPELRKAKTDMKPVKKIAKYTAYYGSTKIMKADNSWLASIQKLWIDNFPDETQASTDFYFKHLYQEKNTWLLVHERQLISMLQIRPMNISLQGKAVEIPFIAGVATHPYYQHCGYMKKLLNHVLKTYQAADDVYLQAYDWDLYKPFGFKINCWMRKTTVEKTDSIPTGKLIETKDASLLLSCYQKFTADKDGYRIRTLEEYQNYYLPYAALDSKIYLYKQNDKITGCFTVSMHDSHLLVQECYVENNHILNEMLTCLNHDSITVYTHESLIPDGKSELVPCLMNLNQTYSFSVNHYFSETF